MGHKAERSGVSGLGKDRIQFDFELKGRRYRPSIKRIPTQGNLTRALGQLRGIRKRIARGTFSFAEEFPDYRFMKRVPGVDAPRTCNAAFDSFIRHGESRVAPRVAKKDMAFARADPAAGLKSLRITRKDHDPIDPFAASEAEALILALHRDWGEAQGNYDEFRFFTDLRPSEQIALLVSDCDLVRGKIKVTKARVMNLDKDRTKTNVDRTVELCPRALRVLNRQLALRDRLRAAGLLHHEMLFCKEDGSAITNLQCGYERWKKTLNQTVKGRDTASLITPDIHQ